MEGSAEGHPVGAGRGAGLRGLLLQARAMCCTPATCLTLSRDEALSTYLPSQHAERALFPMPSPFCVLTLKQGHRNTKHFSSHGVQLRLRPGMLGVRRLHARQTSGPQLREAKHASALAHLFAGGERSFTTLCFLLALACEVVSPFHALDEFDVFQVRAEGSKTLSALDMR